MLNEEVLEVLECEFKAIKEGLLQDVDELSEKTCKLIQQVNEKVYDGLGLLEEVISYWICSEENTFDMETLEGIMGQLLNDIEERRDLK